MIRTTAVPRSVRTGAALAGIVGIAALTGCGAQAVAEEEPTTTETTTAQSSTAQSSTEQPAETTAAEPAATSLYADGTYTAEGSYATPETVETISVTLTLEGDVVTAVEVTGDPQARESENYQGQFIGGIADVVVGKNIDELAVSRVAGSSLTSGGFNQALEQIKSEAAS